MSNKLRHQFTSAVFVALKDQSGRYLLQRRVNTGYMDNHYDLSATGHVEADESLWDCAIREAREEIGVEINEEDLRPAVLSQMNVDIPYLNITFICEKWQGDPRIGEPEKCDDLHWFSPDELPKLCTPTVRILESLGNTIQMQVVYVDRQKHIELMGGEG